MAGNSIELALHNRTTVEKLGAKTKINILAIRKSNPEVIAPQGQNMMSNILYREITYPLPVHHTSTETENLPNRVLSAQAIPNTQDKHSDTESSELSADGVNPGTSNEAGNREDTASPRDLTATRTFAVLKMLAAGDNPWDLGSVRLNWNTVMGNSPIHWFLPTLSPCTNHEDTESQFSLGPAVERLRAAHNLKPASSNAFQNRVRPPGSGTEYSTSSYPSRDWRVSSTTNTSPPNSGDRIQLESINGPPLQTQHIADATA
jgi:palmitoyltransferase